MAPDGGASSAGSGASPAARCSSGGIESSTIFAILRRAVTSVISSPVLIGRFEPCLDVMHPSFRALSGRLEHAVRETERGAGGARRRCEREGSGFRVENVGLRKKGGDRSSSAWTKAASSSGSAARAIAMAPSCFIVRV